MWHHGLPATETASRIVVAGRRWCRGRSLALAFQRPASSSSRFLGVAAGGDLVALESDPRRVKGTDGVPGPVATGPAPESRSVAPGVGRRWHPGCRRADWSSCRPRQPTLAREPAARGGDQSQVLSATAWITARDTGHPVPWDDVPRMECRRRDELRQAPSGRSTRGRRVETAHPCRLRPWRSTTGVSTSSAPPSVGLGLNPGGSRPWYAAYHGPHAHPTGAAVASRRAARAPSRPRAARCRPSPSARAVSVRAPRYPALR